MKSFLFLTLVLALAGCATAIDVTRLDTFPTAKKADVRVFLNKDSVKRAYREFAILSADDKGYNRSDSQITDELVKKAQELGADAIILHGHETVSAGGTILGASKYSGGYYVQSHRKIIRAIAIEYQN